MNSQRLMNGLLIAFAVVTILVVGKPLLIPFVIAFIFWFLIKEIRNLINRIPFVNKHIPNIVLNIFGLLTIFFIIGGIVKILSVNIQQITASMPIYQENIVKIAGSLNKTFNVDIIASTKEFIGEFKYGSLLSKVLVSLREIFGKAFLIIIYTIFLMLEEQYFSRKIKAIYSNKHNYKEIDTILKQIDYSIGRYLSIKTMISFLTGFLSYFALIFIGIDAPLFWAFLIFLMNYIPTIGSLIATIFPAVFAMLQYGDIIPGIWVLAIVGAIQLIIGNVIDPKFTGDSLNVSPLVVIIGLSFWGAVWGILGMVLSVPISVMLIIVFSQIPAMRPVAIILSRKGNINKKNDA